MAIEKYISTEWRIERIFDGSSVKIASGYTPETYIPPEILEFAEAVRPDSKYCYAHVIAMADSEHYGSNMNGDNFRAEELTGTQSEAESRKNRGKFAGKQVPRYKTFEQAKFYRNHANGPMDPHYGDVPLAVWNDVMKRVELIIRIFRQAMNDQPGSRGAPDIAIRIDNGGYITVSMGCRIHHEQCTACGHENELTKDRCDCLLHHMNEIRHDGHQVSADNFGPNFFDISDVGVPAEPIAFSLGKVAGTMFFARPNPAHDVFDAVESAMKSAWREKWSEIEKQVPGQSVVGDMQSDDVCCDATNETPPDLSESELVDVLEKSNGDINAAISTLTACGVVLSPTELAVLSSLATPHGQDDFSAPTSVAMDKFSYAAFETVKHKLAWRSGFTAPRPATGWEPAKIAEMGGQTDSAVEMADYYAYYRRLICSLSVDHFTKEAYCNSAVREIQGGMTDLSRVKAAMYYLAYAGLLTT